MRLLNLKCLYLVYEYRRSKDDLDEVQRRMCDQRQKYISAAAQGSFRVPMPSSDARADWSSRSGILQRQVGTLGAERRPSDEQSAQAASCAFDCKKRS